MKTTFKELFADFEDDLIGIPADTFCVETTVDQKLITKRLLSRISHKRPYRKVINIALIAASLAVVLGIVSTMILAGSDLQIVFEEFFGGSMNAAGLYDGGDVQINCTDPNLDVTFLGVTGDEHEVYALFRAVKKDGGTFTDEGYLYPTTTVRSEKYDEALSSEKEPGELMSELASCNGIQAAAKDRYGHNIGYCDDGNVAIDSFYFLSEDRKTLKLLVKMDVYQDKDARDGTLAVKSVCFTARKIIRTILTDDHLDGEVHDRYIQRCAEMNVDTTKCIRLETPDQVIFCQAESKEVPLRFEATVKMNYRYYSNIRKSLQASDAPHFIKPDTSHVQMTISPFSVLIEGEHQNYNDDECFYSLDGDTSRVVMKDGSVYYFADMGVSSGGGAVIGKMVSQHKMNYEKKPHQTLFAERILLDTREIDRIMINGDTVYQS